MEIVMKEMGEIHNCTLGSWGFTPSCDFMCISVMYTVCHAMRTFLRHFKCKQQAYKETIHRLLAQDARKYYS